jgi:hypothetical protein
MKQRKKTHEDCRGGVFSMQVISGYPRKTVGLAKNNKSIHEIIDEKTVAIKKENG